MPVDVTAPALSLYETEMIEAVQKALQASQSNFGMYELGIMLSMIVIAVAAIIYVLWRTGLIGKGKETAEMCEDCPALDLDVKRANDAHSIVCQKDTDGIPYILRTPILLREFKEVVKGLQESVEKLANHNMDVLLDLHDKLLKK